MSAHMVHPGIVAGVDGSGPSQAAVRWAAHEAALRGLSLTLVHVVDGVMSTWPQTTVPTGLGAWQQQRGRQFIEDAVKIVADSTSDVAAVQLNTEIYYSAAVPTLVDMSRDAEFVVVGSRTHGPLGRLLGSVSSGLVHHAHCPVAVVHEDQPATRAPVLVGVDGSPASELATAIAFDEASRRRVDLITLHAWSDVGLSEFPGIDWPAMQSSEEAVLAERLAGWQERYPDVTVHRRVVRDHPARQLVEQSESAQLVLVGSRGRGGFAGMLLGSVSAAVVNSARVPVIVARH